jgi:hypothetical protein
MSDGDIHMNWFVLKTKLGRRQVVNMLSHEIHHGKIGQTGKFARVIKLDLRRRLHTGVGGGRPMPEGPRPRSDRDSEYSPTTVLTPPRSMVGNLTKHVRKRIPHPSTHRRL